MTWRLGVSWMLSCWRPRRRACWMLVKWGGIRASDMSGLRMPALRWALGGGEGTGLGEQGGGVGGGAGLGEAVHLDEGEEIAGVFAADEAVEGEGHALHVDVLAVVAHGAGHVEEDGRRRFGGVLGAVDFDVRGEQRHSDGVTQ